MFARVGLPWYLFAGVGLTHAVLVAVTGYGLLRMARWAMRMFALWAVVAVIATVLPGVAGAAPKSRVVFTTSVAVATLVAFGLYVRGHLARWQERPVANGVE
jgi:hypothetical protein